MGVPTISRSNPKIKTAEEKTLQFFNSKLQLETTWEFPQFQDLTLKSRRQKPLQFFNNKLQLETTWE
ncbi:hypothetical protein, partial [Leptospira interrogans]|uniref:hypothetical protein n=1 Tax=Leptospira interrogans TaxID=173 RepID=UPI003D0694A5